MVEYYRTRVTVAASMRGHGVMLPFGLRVATIGLVTHDKVQSFYNDIGHAEWAVEMTAAMRADGGAGVARELGGVLSHIDAHRRLVHEQIVSAQARLMEATAANMRAFAAALLGEREP